MRYLALFFGCMSMHALAIEMSITPENPRPQETLFIKVSGLWHNSCVPEFKSDGIQGNHVKLYARINPECEVGIVEDVETPFVLSYQPNNWMKSIFTSDENYYFLEFYINNDNASDLFAFDIVRIQSPEDYHLAPESGFWWVDANGQYGSEVKGSGFSIDRQGSHLTVMAQFYDESGAPVWFYSEGNLDRGVYKAELKKISGGKTLYANSNGNQNIENSGTLFITFNSKSSGTAWIVNDQISSIDGISLKPISIRRYQNINLKGANIFKGDWIMVPENTQSELPMIRVKFNQEVKKRPNSWLYLGLNSQLLCDVIGEEEKHAQSCVLQDHDGNGIAILDDIGLEKSLGIHINSGQRVQFIKIK